MVRIVNGKSILEVVFFDGIYEVTRKCCYAGHGLFQIFDDQDGEQWQVTRGYRDHVSYYFDLDITLDIMEETCNLDASDREWLYSQVKEV